MEFHPPIPKEVEIIGRQIVIAAGEVHEELGPGLLKEIYVSCLCYELETQELQTQRNVEVSFEYKDVVIDEGLVIEILVAGEVACGVLVEKEISQVSISGILSQLRLTGLRLGYLINFNVPKIEQGIRRFAL